MRVLTSKYWQKKFKKTIIDKNGKKHVVRDGKKFEELVQKILDLEYGPNHWKATGNSWDGSRDFEWRTAHSYKWAECKNYEQKISLNVLSNTLVMAMIDFADEILIFSYSKIKQPVLNRLMQFADVSQKKIKIYADESLEEIIFSHFTELKSGFFPSACFTEVDLERLMPYISCQVIADPVVAYSMNTDLGAIPKSPSDINFDTLLCLNIYFCNRASRNIAVEISIKWTPGDFSVLNPDKKADKKFTLASNAIVVKKIYFRVHKFNPVLHFPEITIFCDAQEKKFSFGSVKCSWIGDCVLQGSSYKKIKNIFETRVVKGSFFRAINLYGTSGVGKSRLLKECENIALGHGYRVIRFQTNFQDQEYCNTKNIIIEFLCGLYDIPNLEELFADAQKEHLSGIYPILYFIHENSIDFNYIEKTIVPVVTQKLMKTHCYISIDNIQYYPTPFISLLHLIINQLLIENRHCKSRIGISFNMDYIYQQDKCVSLWNFLCNNENYIIKKEITGFATGNETRLFLNQLLQNSDIEPEQAQIIVDASNGNPFYVQTYLKLLEAENIIIPQKDGYIISPSMQEAFKEKMSCIPKDISSLLENRWNYYLKDHDAVQSLQILGVVHIFQKLNNELIQKFCLSTDIINELCNFHFLIRQTKTELVYAFEHDLMEMFLVKKYTLLCRYAFCVKTLPQDVNYEWYKVLYIIIMGTREINFLNSRVAEKEPPYKIGYEIYTLWMSHVVQKINSIEELENNLQHMTKVCETAREIYGTDSAITLYRCIINKVKAVFDHYQANSNWAWVMISYCNILYERNMYQEAITEIKNLLCYWHRDKITFENVVIYAYLYNRLHVYHRALHKYVTEEVISWLEKAEELQDYPDTPEEVSDQIKFINLIDRGYCNYEDISSKDALLEAWGKACEIYEKGRIPFKKVNYLYTKMQLYLFRNDLTKAWETIKNGLKVIDMKEQGTYYFLYFKQRYLLCLIVYLLMDNRFRQREIGDLFSQVEDYNCIMKGRISYSIQWLKSIYYWYQKKYEDAFMCIQSTKFSLYESKKKTFQSTFSGQLYDNARYFLAKGIVEDNISVDTEQLSDSKLISVLKDTFQMSKRELKLYINAHRATSILQEKEHKINFPTL